MPVKSIVMGCLLVSPVLNAQELQHAAQGLAVSIETLEGTTHVNGLPMVVSRATGPAVPLLARNLISRWREALGWSSVRTLDCCGWKFASMLQSGESRVIQWRTTTSGHELLWSSTRIPATKPVPPRTRVSLPADCRWTPPIHGRVAGRDFVQLSAHCGQAPDTVLDRLATRLGAEGWRWHRRTPLVMQAERNGVQVEVIAGTSPPLSRAGSGGSSLVVVESHPAKAGPR